MGACRIEMRKTLGERSSCIIRQENLQSHFSSGIGRCLDHLSDSTGPAGVAAARRDRRCCATCADGTVTKTRQGRPADHPLGNLNRAADKISRRRSFWDHAECRARDTAETGGRRRPGPRGMNGKHGMLSWPCWDTHGCLASWQPATVMQPPGMRPLERRARVTRPAGRGPGGRAR